ncbi:hypothetical protein [Brevibacterium mcbrellneri]|nr:hypothetical protein [Brevibacterium mcbrellneri]
MGDFHKPVMRPDLDGYSEAPGPAQKAEAAHDLAHLLIHDPSVPRDQAATDRFIALEQEFGLETLAELWSSAPAVSLPGALYRLYALHSWITRQPDEASGWFSAGRLSSPAEVVAGVADPPGPREVESMAREILSGAFRGDFAHACDRAAAFVFVAARGRATEDGPGLAEFHRMGEDLRAAARLYREGGLA